MYRCPLSAVCADKHEASILPASAAEAAEAAAAAGAAGAAGAAEAAGAAGAAGAAEAPPFHICLRIAAAHLVTISPATAACV